ncbi:hypothetical protein JHK87_044910 [Glycine soja]|nr:hypothetical protein JHK87_044910 [Glycine soja]
MITGKEEEKEKENKRKEAIYDDDLGALQQLLVDQPNIQIEEGLHESQHQNIQIPDVEQEAVYFQLQ